ncbi:MAG TPA: nitrilase-related carbon-nitrogen hydrolase, partial [Clostridia bacterium]|nr:nitrilase-related carbon-nitrogen hydrolase [Clostridia bacterium]
MLPLRWFLFVLAVLVLSLGSASAAAKTSQAPAGWKTSSPREEIRPEFAFEPRGGADGQGCFVIRADKREGLDGCWTKSFPVVGGRYYRFSALYKAKRVAIPRRSILVKLDWQDAQGQVVSQDPPVVENYLKGAVAIAETESPVTRGTNSEGWTEIADVYRIPSKAVQAVVSLHLQWAPRGEVRWSNIVLEEITPPAPRTVRLATVHFRPGGGKTPMDNCRMYAPLIAEAAQKKADLVVLGETLTAVNLGKPFHELAEPIPGPSTEYFAGLAKQHNLYIV